MKVLAWALFVFSCIAMIGLLTTSEVEQGTVYGAVYAGLVIAFTGMWLWEEHKSNI